VWDPSRSIFRIEKRQWARRTNFWQRLGVLSSKEATMHRREMDDSSSDAQTVSSFGDFGFGGAYSGGGSESGGSGHGVGTRRAGVADEHDIDYLRKKNSELKKELKRVQKAFDEQGQHLGVTTRKTELVYKSFPAIPYSPAWNFSPRGLEYTQLYFWVIRDALWMQQNGDGADGVGYFCIALAGLSVVIAAWLHRSTLTSSQEFFHALSRLIWVVGMFVWMQNAVVDTEGNDASDIYTPKGSPGRFIGTCILVVALVISFTVLASRFASARVVLKPDESIAVSQAVQMKPFEEPRLRARFYFLFSSYRDWEMAAMFLWIGKDTAASQQLSGWWTLFYVFCYCVMVFQLTVSINTRKALIDHLHYCATALWLLGNFIYQWGHIYGKLDSKNNWEYMYPRHKSPQYVSTYMGNTLVLLAFVPVGLLYFVWILATVMDWIHYDALEPVAWDVPAAELVSVVWRALVGVAKFVGFAKAHPLTPHFYSPSSPPPPLYLRHFSRKSTTKRSLTRTQIRTGSRSLGWRPIRVFIDPCNLLSLCVSLFMSMRVLSTVGRRKRGFL